MPPPPQRRLAGWRAGPAPVGLFWDKEIVYEQKGENNTTSTFEYIPPADVFLLQDFRNSDKCAQIVHNSHGEEFLDIRLAKNAYQAWNFFSIPRDAVEWYNTVNGHFNDIVS